MKYRLIFIFLTAPFFLFAQDKWGFSVASIKTPVTDSTSSELIYISKVVRLSDIECVYTVANQIRENSFYSHCISHWFYEKIIASNMVSAEQMDNMVIAGQIELHSDLPEFISEQLKDRIHTHESIYLSRKMARKKRKQFSQPLKKSSGITIHHL